MKLKTSSNTPTNRPKIRLKGSTSLARTEKSKKRGEAFKSLAEALLTCLEYNELEQVKEQMCSCCDTFLEDEEFAPILTNKVVERILKMKIIIQGLENKQRLEAYVYNLILGCDGLRVHQVVRK